MLTEKLLHFTRLFTLALHTVAGSGDTIFEMGRGESDDTGSGIWYGNIRKQEHMSKTLLGTSCLLDVEQSL